MWGAMGPEVAGMEEGSRREVRTFVSACWFQLKGMFRCSPSLILEFCGEILGSDFGKSNFVDKVQTVNRFQAGWNELEVSRIRKIPQYPYIS